ncbi:hypothetical protein HZH66_000618 [Vespula vulgaris]|uniref:Uncharacterized protein n=1 Tax=Vespula vulgaris TaxID=7454 RepID=A0A834NJI4_VESVU|nr:hypothetical protein HZH66_000618 [Vespula vulgaris]
MVLVSVFDVDVGYAVGSINGASFELGANHGIDVTRFVSSPDGDAAHFRSGSTDDTIACSESLAFEEDEEDGEVEEEEEEDDDDDNDDDDDDEEEVEEEEEEEEEEEDVTESSFIESLIKRIWKEK